jgi:peptide/nickel transport system permease protein
MAISSQHLRTRNKDATLGVPLRRMTRLSPVIAASLLLALLLVLTAILAPQVATHDIRSQSLLSRLQPPAVLGGEPSHLLGTDQLGRDIFSRLLFALRTSLTIATLGMLIGVTIGTSLGLISGLLGGLIDDIIMFAVDTQAALPFTLLAITAVALFGTSPAVLIAIIGLAGWDTYARVVRGQVLAARELPFVEASRALGAPLWRVATQHILPNIVSPILVLATMNFSTIVLTESALSFLGLGIQPPATSLGQMLGEGRDYMATAWWIAAAPATVIVVITMIVSLIGDWLRDELDPAIASAIRKKSS